MRIAELINQMMAPDAAKAGVLFRVDAGRKPGLSYGHLMRCHRLSQALRQKGIAARFIMNADAQGMAAARDLGETVITPAECQAILKPGSWGAVVTDLPGGPDDQWQRQLQGLGLWRVVIDDLNSSIASADVVLNPSILARPDSYPKGARLLLGPEYLVLPDAFADAAQAYQNRPQRRPGRVLLFFGGSDPTNLSQQVLQTLLRHYSGNPWPESLCMILGPGYDRRETIQKMIDNGEPRVEVIHSPEDLLPHFLAADLVISAGGLTLYELWHLGVPTLAVASAPHEAAAVEVFANKGWLLEGLEAWDREVFLAAWDRCLQAIRAVKS